MKKNNLYLLILIFLACSLTGQHNAISQSFTVAFYNVENLFDVEDDPLVNDQDFLPDARIPWTMERYDTKLDRIAQVLSSLDDDELPAIIGLCEVENRKVLDDLVQQKELKEGKYQIIHYDSPDERGIDNALLYKKNAFQVIRSKPVRVVLTKDQEDRTRDILYVKGIVKKSPQDTLHLFVNHWPSRGGGQEASEPNRVDAARTLKQQVDSIFQLNESASIIAMGDFNDEPLDSSLHRVLEAYDPSIGPKTVSTMYNMMLPLAGEDRGTIYYRSWQIFDQIILSTNLIMKKTGLVLPGSKGSIFSEEWLMYKANDGSLRPNRTAAKEYYGGYSDHLPVYIEFEIR